MKPIPWPTVGIVWIASAALFFAFLERGLGWAQVGVAAIAALALCVGALFAPASVTGPPAIGPEYRDRKAVQVVAAGLVAVVLAGVVDNPGTAAIFGIVAALAVGTALPRQNEERADGDD